jgi:transcriptional regulator with XRE-family HTH domain
MSDKIIHQGRNIKRIREIQGIKQEALAIELGDDWNQKKISLLESKEVVDEKLLNEIAKALKVSPEAVKNFNEESAINIISNTFHDFHDNAVASAMNYQCNFNPLDEFFKAMEENKKLYERLLQSEREKLELLERMLGKNK